LSITRDANDIPYAKVSFGGIRKDICLAYTPEARVGDYVLVHVGFAISRIDADEAHHVFEYLEQLGAVSEMEDSAGKSSMAS
jgi:hydrogenase expression/formation protein HypC